ncbi:hypothetical protein [Streptomyces sp. NPDC002845]
MTWRSCFSELVALRTPDAMESGTLILLSGTVQTALVMAWCRGCPCTSA